MSCECSENECNIMIYDVIYTMNVQTVRSRNENRRRMQKLLQTYMSF